MYVTFKMVAEMFSQASGIKDSDLVFYTISDSGDVPQPRGLFIPLWDNADDLLAAINNGAVAAIWEKDRPLPAYKPNHFPIFFSNNLSEDFISLMNHYFKILKQEDEREPMSNIHIISDENYRELLKEDDRALYEMLKKLTQSIGDLRRG
jgi:hypothetical protein